MIRGAPARLDLHDVAQRHQAAVALRVIASGGGAAARGSGVVVVGGGAGAAAEAVGDGGAHGPLLQVGVEKEGEGGAGKVPEIGHQPE